MNQLDQSSQSNAASSEEIASTAEEISSQSNQMQSLVIDLSNIVTGSAPQSEPTPTKHRHDSSARMAAPKSNSKVIKFQPARIAAKSKSPAADMIPFDSDEPRSKVGTTDGF
jgi:hypothetical protein